MDVPGAMTRKTVIASSTPLAGSLYYASQDEAPMSRPGSRSVGQRGSGHFTCSLNEQRTKLERKNCGGQRF